LIILVSLTSCALKSTFGHELIYSPPIECEECPFTWKDVEIYALPVGDSIDFKAILTFKNMKDMKMDESKYKRIVVSTVSTCSAVEDSMRLLLILGLMDGVFDNGITTWSDLMLLLPPEAG
jgi:hypothetical protein